jgi:hypothetical protein
MIYILFYLQDFGVKYLKFVSLIYFFLVYRLLLMIHEEYGGMNVSSSMSIDLLLVSYKKLYLLLLLCVS